MGEAITNPPPRTVATELEDMVEELEQLTDHLRHITETLKSENKEDNGQEDKQEEEPAPAGEAVSGYERPPAIEFEDPIPEIARVIQEKVFQQRGKRINPHYMHLFAKRVVANATLADTKLAIRRIRAKFLRDGIEPPPEVEDRMGDLFKED